MCDVPEHMVGLVLWYTFWYSAVGHHAAVFEMQQHTSIQNNFACSEDDCRA